MRLGKDGHVGPEVGGRPELQLVEDAQGELEGPVSALPLLRAMAAAAAAVGDFCRAGRAARAGVVMPTRCAGWR